MLATRYISFGVGLLFFAYIFLEHKEPKEHEGSEILYTNPYIFRALNPHSYTLSADFLWLKSQYISEMRVKYSDIDSRYFFDAFKTIAIMDPNFFPAINYGAIFLASMKDEAEKAEKIVDEALKFAPTNIELQFLKLMINASYKKEKNSENIYNLAKIVATNPNASKFLREDLIKSFAKDMVLFSQNSNLTLEQRIGDLVWLKENTESEESKEEIEKIIFDIIKKSKN